jgi:hypothetical protein
LRADTSWGSIDGPTGIEIRNTAGNGLARRIGL